MKIERQPLTRLVRILCSEEQEGFRDMFSSFVHQAADDGISVAMLIPPTILEIDLLELAAGQRWDLAILFLNNIRYSSSDRTTAANAVNLVRKMKQLFDKPIVCFCGLGAPMGASVELLGLPEAGANAFFFTPCKTDEVVPVLRALLDEVRGL
jgi:hypothetical protein